MSFFYMPISEVHFKGFHKHALAQGSTTSTLHDGECDGGRQVMKMRNEFPTRTFGENRV